MKIVTIARNPKNSPNMVTNDAAILESISKELTALGANVVALDEGADIPDDTHLVCHMSRTPEVLEKLKNAQKRGITVVNTPESVENCSRIRVMEILEKNAISQPLFRIIAKEKDLSRLTFPAWIKRGDGWSCHKNDIRYATNEKEAAEAIADMRNRGIETFIHTVHCQGDIIKFYGVGSDYFTYSYPNADKTKFGLEKFNGETMHHPFDTEAMHSLVAKAARAIGLEIYGGDCIVDEEGNIILIDLNDFPSFSSVRDEAAREIAKQIISKTTI